jgi:hypothetical protein
MDKSFLSALKNTKEQISDIYFMFKTRTKSTYFTRNSAKMSFVEVTHFILRNICKSLQIDLNDFFEEFKKNSLSITKQAFSQIREKISPLAFIDLNDNFINWFYSDGAFKKFKGFRLLAVDGSITEVPNTEKTRSFFGHYNNQSEFKLARSMVSVIYDIENDLIVESNICNWRTAERDVAKELITQLEIKGFRNDLIIFDRGYPSKNFISFLESKSINYLMRAKNKKFSTQIDKANEDNQIIYVDYEGKTLIIRVINIILPTGEVEKLITNVYDENFSNEDFKKLYFKRWGIEVKYNQLKSIYEIEKFSGTSPIAIMQDFYATIYLSNMMSLAKNEANLKISKEKTDLKYEYKVNMNILVPKIRKILIECLITDDENKRIKIFENAISIIIKNLVPIRPNRNFLVKNHHEKTSIHKTKTFNVN